MNTGFCERWNHLSEQFAGHDAICYSGQRITYRKLAERANAYARQLADLALRNTCIPVLVACPIHHISALLGILLSGNYYHSISPEQAPAINHLLKRVCARALIATEDLVRPDQLPDSISIIKSSALAHHPYNQTSIATEPLSAFCLFMTSGTTGEPKQVIHTHQSVLTDTDRQISANQIGSTDRIDLLFSLEFSASLACIFPALLTGATLVIHNLRKEGVLSLPAFWQAEQISFSTLAVSSLRLLLKSSFNFKTLDRLRFLSIGAEPVHQRDIEGFRERFGDQTTLQIAYATTETRTISEHKIRTTTPWDTTLNSVGKAVSGRTVRIRSETGDWLEPGQVGEIIVQAKTIPQAYANNPVASRQAYQIQPDGLISYATGDLGYLDEAGYLFWCGRTDFVIKKNGQKINLLQLEDALRQAPGVGEVAVVCDLLTMDQPVIQVFLRPEASFDLPALKHWLADRYPVSMLPDIYQSVPELPRTRTGKVDRSALLHQYPIKRSNSSVLPNDPANSLIAHIKKIWAQELNYPKPIADYDDFFRDLGGDSLTAEACLSMLETHIGQSLPMQLAFSYPTPQALASFIMTPAETGVQCISLNLPVAGRPRVYFIPPLSGDKRIYQWLEASLGGQANLYCLYFSPFTANGQLRALPELCDSMASAIDTSSPNLLIGYSFGGILAYEVVLRLDRRSPEHRQNRLVLVDTPLYKRYHLGYVVAQDLKRGWHKLQRGIQAREPFNWSANLQRIMKRYHGRLKPSAPLLTTTDWQEQANFAAQTYSHQVTVQKPVQRSIILFRASDTSFFQQDIIPDYTWQDYTRNGVEEYPLDTNHYHVLNQANSAHVACVLLPILTQTS